MTREQLLRLAYSVPEGAEITFSIDVSEYDSDSQDRVYLESLDEIKQVRDNKFVLCGEATSCNF